MVGGYGKCSVERKFAICDLTLQLQQLMVVDEAQCDESFSSKRGLSVMVPNAQNIRSQPQKRLAPRSEVDSNNAKNKKIKFSILPGGQEFVHGCIDDIVKNVKPAYRSHCAFCQGDHQYPSCDTRSTLKTMSHEFILSSSTPNVSQSLRDRLQYSMPYIVWTCEVPALTTLSQEQQRMNVIIHEAARIDGQPVGQIESMNFRVTFLNSNAKDMNNVLCTHTNGSSSVWISGVTMCGIVSSARKKRRFVFDKTNIFVD